MDPRAVARHPVRWTTEVKRQMTDTLEQRFQCSKCGTHIHVKSMILLKQTPFAADANALCRCGNVVGKVAGLEPIRFTYQSAASA
jgi:hypothetical protein